MLLSRTRRYAPVHDTVASVPAGSATRAMCKVLYHTYTFTPEISAEITLSILVILLLSTATSATEYTEIEENISEEQCIPYQLPNEILEEPSISNDWFPGCPLPSGYREVKAEDILKQIKNGEDINYTHCRIVGKLDLNKIKIRTAPNPKYSELLNEGYSKKDLFYGGVSENSSFSVFTI